MVTPDPVALECVAHGVELRADAEFAVLSKRQVAQALGPRAGLAGWYFQQLLKFDVALRLGVDRALVLDADTVLLTPQAPPASVPDFPSSSEHHLPYFKGFEALLGIPAPLGSSAIVNFMWLERRELEALVAHIEANRGAPWRDAVLGVSATEGHAFSEYETYANWVALRRRVTRSPLRLFRRGDLLVEHGAPLEALITRAARRGFDAVAFEHTHRSSLARRLLAQALFSLGRTTGGTRYV